MQRVASFLKQAGAEARIEEFRAVTTTAEDAATALGVTLDQIVKTLVFDCDGRPVVVMIAGDRRADRKKVMAAARCNRAQIVGSADVERLTGFAPGAVAPFPLPSVRRAFLDRSLLLHDIVWIGAGSNRHLAAIAPPELLRLARAAPADLSESRREDSTAAPVDKL